MTTTAYIFFSIIAPPHLHPPPPKRERGVWKERYGVVPEGLLTFLGFLGNAGLCPWKRLPEFIELRDGIKMFAVVFVTASDAMDSFFFFFFFFFFGGGGYRLCRVPEIKSYILSCGHSVSGGKIFFSGGLSLEAIYQSSGSSLFVKTTKES